MKRVLLIGANGYFGAYLHRELATCGWEVEGWGGIRASNAPELAVRSVDLTEPSRVRAAFLAFRPDAVIHAAALASVAECHRQPALAHFVNVQGTDLLCELSASLGARMIYIGTDMVFDGEKGNYREYDGTAPVSVYGKTKLAAERSVRSLTGSLIVRISLLFGPSLGPRPSFFDQQVQAVRHGQPLTLFQDEWRTPLSNRTAARAINELLQSEFVGVLHIGGPERMSRLDMGRRLARHLDVEGQSIVAAHREQFEGPEPRPRDLSLDSARWRELCPELPWPTFEESLSEMGTRAC
jgi:dTDP-4-dehydrorhamnose reductase